MPVLKKRWEVFAREIAKNIHPAQAYENAGYKAKNQNVAHASGCKLLKNEEILARINEINGVIAGVSEKSFLIGEIGNRVSRVAFQNERWMQHQRLMKARAEMYREVPGGDTGLIVRQVKVVGTGKNAREIDEYKYDAALMQEIRELERHAATELGQWSEKQEVTVKPAEPSEDYSKIPLETLESALNKMREARAMLTIEAAPGSVEEVVQSKDGT